MHFNNNNSNTCIVVIALEYNKMSGAVLLYNCTYTQNSTAQIWGNSDIVKL